MEPEEPGLATLCAHAARGAGARRVFWCPDDGGAVVAGPGRIAPRELEWRWIEARRGAGPGVTRRGRTRLRRALRDAGDAELWLVRGALDERDERALVGGVLGLEFAGSAPRGTDDVDLAALWRLALELQQHAHGAALLARERAHAARGRHAAQLVHDLRHELTLVRVLAASKDAGHGELERVLDGAAELCTRALAAPEDLAAPVTVPAAHALRRAVEDVTRAREHARTLSFEVAAAPDLTVLADRATLARVLANALSNAVEATPRGGTVRLVARALEGGVELAIEDQGRGVDRRRLALLARGEGARRGPHGHGFDSARAAARALGSELVVASRVASGTSAHGTSRAELGGIADGATGTRVSLTLPSGRGRETILLVDPVARRRRALASALERAGWGSLECADARSALRGLAARPRAVAIARGAAASGGEACGLAALQRRARALSLPCFVLGSVLEAGDARERAGALTARLSEADGS